jgi:signal transduction histidine kinase
VTNRQIAAVAVLGILAGALAVAVVITSDHVTGKAATIALAVPTGLAYIGSGLVLRRRRPRNGTGGLMILVGFAWFFAALPSANDSYLFTLGIALTGVFIGLLAHLFLAFPSGKLGSRTDRMITAATYAVVSILPLTALLLDDGEFTEAVCEIPPCPDNVLAAAPVENASMVLLVVYVISAASLSLLVAARMVRRWRRASPPLRAALKPIFVTAGALIVAFAAQVGASFFATPASRAINWFVLTAMLAVPLAFLYGLLRPRLTASVRRLSSELSEQRRPEQVEGVLRRALRDPGLQLGVWTGDGYVDLDARPLALPGEGSGRAATAIGHNVIVHDVALWDQPELDEILDAARIALERGLSLRELESSERRTRALLGAIPDNMYRLSRDGTYLDYHVRNPSTRPHTVDTLTGRNVRDVMPAELVEPVLETIERAYTDGGVQVVNYELPGERRMEARLVRSGRDEVVAIERDVTDLKLTEESLRFLAAEQAALTRVAVAVATGEHDERLFDVVTEEAGRLLGARWASTVRYEGATNDVVVVVGEWHVGDDFELERGYRFALQGGAISRVKETGQPARIEYQLDPDPRERHMVAAPIVVSGRLWGAATISIPGPETFPRDAEERLGKFTNLVAVAIANAQAHEQLAGLAEEQAALTRVALAVATEHDPQRVFDVVTEEAAGVLGAQAANLIRYDPNGDDGIVVGRWHTAGAKIHPIGRRLIFDAPTAVAMVREHERPVRLTDPDSLGGVAGDRLRALGVKSSIAAPIFGSGELWGAVVLSSPDQNAFAPGDEDRLGKFASLVAVAISNAEARDRVATLAEEQAALSRVAVAVAASRTPQPVFDVVTEEVGKLFGAQGANLTRYEDDPETALVVGSWEAEAGTNVPKGHRITMDSPTPLAIVRRTGEPARVDSFDDIPGETAAHVRGLGVRSAAAAPVNVGGRRWGAVVVTSAEAAAFGPEAEQRLAKFAGLVALAIANTEAHEELTASRARIVRAGDDERQRLERNLHDGAQQRLVALSLSLRLAQSKLADPASARAILDAASEELARALEELRELARGIHPAILSDRGLVPALEALAARAPVPVTLGDLEPDRLPPDVEAAAYYVVAESLTNVAKYAGATAARVRVERRNGVAVVEVADDGVGGADPSLGTGLRGLADRVEALDGHLSVTSSAGRGTTVRAEIPLEISP